MPGAGVGDGGTKEQVPGESSQSTSGSGKDEGQPRTEGQGGEASDTQSSQSGESRADTGQFEAPITGNPGSLTGGITKVENPTGRGIAPDENNENQPGGQQDRVYVPGAVEGSGNTGQAPDGREPENSGPAPVLPGVADDTSRNSGNGDQAGKLTEVRTPYKEVLRDYAQRATDAIENSYIPADAKKLVRDYFVGLER
jgi:hypothetical protein